MSVLGNAGQLEALRRRRAQLLELAGESGEARWWLAAAAVTEALIQLRWRRYAGPLGPAGAAISRELASVPPAPRQGRLL